MKSQESATNTSTPSEETPVQTVQKALAKEAGVSRLLQMAGVDSLVASMEQEDKNAKEWSKKNSEALWGDPSSDDGEPSAEDDSMRLMVAGDINNYTEAKAAKTEEPIKTVAPPAQPKISKLSTAAIVAASLLGGGLATGTAISLMQPRSPAAVAEDLDTQYQFGIGFLENEIPER